MKSLSLCMMLLLSSILFSSCSKDTAEEVFTMEGTWTGKIGTGPVSPAAHFSIKLKENGIAERINSSGSVSGTGTWQLSGTSFNAAYTLSSGTEVTLTGVFNDFDKRLSGTWSNGSEGGSWNATKE